MSAAQTEAMPKDYSRLAEEVEVIARRAGREILEVYKSDASVTAVKEDNSPLTLADTRSHETIIAALAELTPAIAVLSEESAEIPFEERSGWPLYWLVDPLDGTKEFLSRNGEFTVNIALIKDHAPVLGVVHVPVTDRTYYGGTGLGAWRRDGQKAPIRIEVQSRAPQTVRVVGSRSHRGASLDGFLQRLGSCELLSVGSSLKFCLVAEGAADVYPRLGPTSEWDTAAAHAVVSAAGGKVMAVNGAELVYNTKPELLNPHFIVYGDSSRRWLDLLG